MEDEKNDVLLPSGLPEELRDCAQIIGTENLMKLVRLKGGETLYIPKESRLNRIVQRQRIREERMEGKTIRELEEKYDLARSTIYRYLSE